MKHTFLSLSFHFLNFLNFTSTFRLRFLQVPAEIRFADLIVRINPQAQTIQLDVVATIPESKPTFKIKQDRVNLYLPLIERELRLKREFH